jgi:hypothetical protein
VIWVSASSIKKGYSRSEGQLIHRLLFEIQYESGQSNFVNLYDLLVGYLCLGYQSYRP